MTKPPSRMSEPECRANANLIAAAPELLEACELALTAITKEKEQKSDWEIPHIIQQYDNLKSVIAKAKGVGQ